MALEKDEYSQYILTVQNDNRNRESKDDTDSLYTAVFKEYSFATKIEYKEDISEISNEKSYSR